MSRQDSCQMSLTIFAEEKFSLIAVITPKTSAKKLFTSKNSLDLLRNIWVMFIEDSRYMAVSEIYLVMRKSIWKLSIKGSHMVLMGDQMRPLIYSAIVCVSQNVLLTNNGSEF